MATHHFCLIELSSGGQAWWNFWYLHNIKTLTQGFLHLWYFSRNCHEMLWICSWKGWMWKGKTEKPFKTKRNQSHFDAAWKQRQFSTSPLLKEMAHLSNCIPWDWNPFRDPHWASLPSTSAFAESIPTTTHYNHELSQIAVENLQISTFSF